MIRTLFNLIRPYYSLPFSLGFIVILSYLTAGQLGPIAGKVMRAFFALFFVVSAGYILNDIFDIQADSINNPSRPLVKNPHFLRPAVIVTIILFALGLLLSVTCGYVFSLSLAGIALLLIIYDATSKHLGMFKDILVAILITSLYPLAFTLTESVESRRLTVLYLHPFWMFFTAIGYEMLKDIRDIKGDCIATGKTASKEKLSRLRNLSRLSICIATIFIILRAALQLTDSIYLMTLLIAIPLAIAAAIATTNRAIYAIFAQVVLITSASFMDLLVFGP